MNLCSKTVDTASNAEGECFNRGFIALKPSSRKPAATGEDGDMFCSKTRSFSINFSDSIGAYNKEINSKPAMMFMLSEKIYSSFANRTLYLFNNGGFSSQFLMLLACSDL